MAKQVKPTLEQEIASTLIAGLVSGKGIAALEDARDVFIEYAKTAKYSARTVRGHPTIKVENDKYSGSYTFKHPRKNLVSRIVGKLSGNVTLQPEDPKKDIVITAMLSLPAKQIIRYFGISSQNSISKITLDNKIIFRLTPNNPANPLSKRTFQYKSTDYSAELKQLPYIGTLPVYNSHHP